MKTIHKNINSNNATKATILFDVKAPHKNAAHRTEVRIAYFYEKINKSNIYHFLKE